MARNKSQKNNNPVNLRFAKQREASGKDADGYAVFPTPEAGWRAAHRQIKLDQKRGLTLKKFIYKFAPPSENDTDNYLNFVAESLYLPEECLLEDISPFVLAGIMARMEGYYNE